MPRVARFHDYATNLSGFSIDEVPKPVPKSGHAVVKIHFAAVNPIDVKLLLGYLKTAWALDLPFTLGHDFSGVIDSLPEGETSFNVGDAVFGAFGSKKELGGSFAEYILIPVTHLNKIPSGLSLEKAAALTVVGTTAHQGLFHFGKLTPGQRVLVLGGSSAVGILAIQLAKLRGNYVVTTASTRNLEFVSQFKPDKVIDYKVNAWEDDEELKGFDVVYDTTGESGGFEKAKKILKTDGVFLTIANFEVGHNPAAHPPLAFAAFISRFNSLADQDELAALVAAGTLELPLEEVFDFTADGVLGALGKSHSGTSRGKTLIKIA
jgi:NADPH:quinone reductase-like Zn-dependent oxidoreductase